MMGTSTDFHYIKSLSHSLIKVPTVTNQIQTDVHNICKNLYICGLAVPKFRTFRGSVSSPRWSRYIQWHFPAPTAEVRDVGTMFLLVAET